MTVAVEQRLWARPICMLFLLFFQGHLVREEKWHTAKILMHSTRSLYVVALALFQCVECGVTSNNVILQLFNNTAHAGTPTFSSRVDRISPDQLRPNTSARFVCQIPFLPPPGVQFSLASDAGFVRLFVDHHLLISGFLSSDNNATTIMSDHVIQSSFNTSLVQIDLTLHETVPGYLTVITHLLYDNSTDAIQCLPIEKRELDDELRYLEEKARHEIGWGNWLSEDITSHVLLPHGLALSLFGDQQFSGPSCQEDQYPLRHGLKTVDGYYSEIEYVRDRTGHAFRIQSATQDNTLVIQIDDYDDSSPSGTLNIQFSIPAAYSPRSCFVGDHNIDCPGLERIAWSIINAASDPMPIRSGRQSLSLVVNKKTSESVFIVVYVPKQNEDPVTAVPVTPSDAQAFVATRRDQAISDLSGNEVLAGVTAAISWNKVSHRF
jgi:hypothetical protein